MININPGSIADKITDGLINIILTGLIIAISYYPILLIANWYLN